MNHPFLTSRGKKKGVGDMTGLHTITSVTACTTNVILGLEEFT